MVTDIRHEDLEMVAVCILFTKPHFFQSIKSFFLSLFFFPPRVLTTRGMLAGAFSRPLAAMNLGHAYWKSSSNTGRPSSLYIRKIISIARFTDSKTIATIITPFAFWKSARHIFHGAVSGCFHQDGWGTGQCTWPARRTFDHPSLRSLYGDM